MAQTNPQNGRTTHTQRTHIHQTEVVTTMSRLPERGLDKNAMESRGPQRTPKKGSMTFCLNPFRLKNISSKRYFVEKYLNSSKNV